MCDIPDIMNQRDPKGYSEVYLVLHRANHLDITYIQYNRTVSAWGIAGNVAQLSTGNFMIVRKESYVRIWNDNLYPKGNLMANLSKGTALATRNIQYVGYMYES